VGVAAGAHLRLAATVLSNGSRRQLHSCTARAASCGAQMHHAFTQLSCSMVRRQQEAESFHVHLHAAGHIPGSLSIPLEELSAAVKAGQLEQHRAVQIAVVGDDSMRGAQAAVRLRKVRAGGLVGGRGPWAWPGYVCQVPVDVPGALSNAMKACITCAQLSSSSVACMQWHACIPRAVQCVTSKEQGAIHAKQLALDLPAPLHHPGMVCSASFALYALQVLGFPAVVHVKGGVPEWCRLGLSTATRPRK
jgi:rhodanese-related sulfurtransferase